MRTRGYSPRTEDSYLRWIERFLRFHDRPHWKTLLGVHAEDFLDHLANDAGLAANSRNQAASALAFLYRQVLGSDAMENFPRARGPETVPLVFSHPEAMKVLRELSGKYRLISSLMYGAGLRVSEASSLRVALVHGSELRTDPPSPERSSGHPVTLGHPETGHRVEDLTRELYLDSLAVEGPTSHTSTDDRLVTEDCILD